VKHTAGKIRGSLKAEDDRSGHRASFTGSYSPVITCAFASQTAPSIPSISEWIVGLPHHGRLILADLVVQTAPRSAVQNPLVRPASSTIGPICAKPHTRLHGSRRPKAGGRGHAASNHAGEFLEPAIVWMVQMRGERLSQKLGSAQLQVNFNNPPLIANTTTPVSSAFRLFALLLHVRPF